MQICTLIPPSQTGSSVCALLICQRASCGLFGISEFRSQRNSDHHNIRNNVNRMPLASFQTGFLPLLSGLSLVLLCWLVLSECPWDTFLKTLQMVPGLHNLRQPGSQASRKWRENQKMEREWGNGEGMRNWRENAEMERNSLSTFPHFLFIPSLSIHFLYQKLSHFVANVEKT